jgi:hypothetical protein
MTLITYLIRSRSHPHSRRAHGERFELPDAGILRIGYCDPGFLWSPVFLL